MSAPDVHIACIVTLGGIEFLVDVGYCAPLLAPIPIESASNQTIILGRDQYILKPRGVDGWSSMELYRDGKLRHGYRLNPRPRRIEEFSTIIADSFREGATFMNALVVARFNSNWSLVLNNLTLIESSGMEARIETIESKDQLPDVIENRFQIPAFMARQAMSGSDLSNDIWG
jgi:arylamine N-acetyltransferase